MNLKFYRAIQGCPARENVAPYIAICVNDAYRTHPAVLDSVYRGADAEVILRRHGKHSQAQLYWLSIHGTPAQRAAVGLNPAGGGANPPGYSTHEMKSDGVAYNVPRGANLPHWWQQGFDVNDGDVAAVKAAAARHGWQLFQPYSGGVEFHHLNFRVEPKPHGIRDRIRIARLRRTLPRR